MTLPSQEVGLPVPFLSDPPPAQEQLTASKPHSPSLVFPFTLKVHPHSRPQLPPLPGHSMPSRTTLLAPLPRNISPALSGAPTSHPAWPKLSSDVPRNLETSFWLLVPRLQLNVSVTCALTPPTQDKDCPKQGWPNFYSTEGHIVNNLSFAGCAVSVTTTQLCHHSLKRALENM